jgi:hypothetical protein
VPGVLIPEKTREQLYVFHETREKKRKRAGSRGRRESVRVAAIGVTRQCQWAGQAAVPAHRKGPPQGGPASLAVVYLAVAGRW